MRDELAAMQARVDAGMYRRTKMLYLLMTVLRVEEDETLPDDKADELMDYVVKQARSLVSIEMLARGRGPWSVRPFADAPNGGK